VASLLGGATVVVTGGGGRVGSVDVEFAAVVIVVVVVEAVVAVVVVEHPLAISTRAAAVSRPLFTSYPVRFTGETERGRRAHPWRRRRQPIKLCWTRR
jgi:hypothetical protein